MGGRACTQPLLRRQSAGLGRCLGRFFFMGGGPFGRCRLRFDFGFARLGRGCRLAFFSGSCGFPLFDKDAEMPPNLVGDVFVD
jgi:hypothetical protein